MGRKDGGTCRRRAPRGRCARGRARGPPGGADRGPRRLRRACASREDERHARAGTAGARPPGCPPPARPLLAGGPDGRGRARLGSRLPSGTQLRFPAGGPGRRPWVPRPPPPTIKAAAPGGVTGAHPADAQDGSLGYHPSQQWPPEQGRRHSFRPQAPTPGCPTLLSSWGRLTRGTQAEPPKGSTPR